MECPYPGGQGPWFCALLCNTAPTSRKQTHIIAHTLPHLSVSFLNSRGNDRWVILMKIGPFSCWSSAVCFLRLWTLRTRGQGRRVDKGMELFQRHCNELHLTMWQRPEEGGEAAEPVAPPLMAMAPPAELRVGDVRSMQLKRRKN
jgi:hypothetical protein